ncbi:hypothetical protein FJY69_04725 [candidate division WOR-3 bacterium]|nr:hypothetical protein [candidate division WOR-3 bacterium]
MPARIKTNLDRQFKYTTKTKPERVKQTSDDVREYALARHQVRQTELASFELQAKEAIDQFDISSALYVGYLNFCREMWKKSNTYTGTVLKRETEAIIAKWKVRDLNEEIMKNLRFQLINVK